MARGYSLLNEYAARVGIPLGRPGALLVAWDEEQLGEFAGIVAPARERLGGGGFRVDTSRGALTTGRLVNAAGLRSDEVDRMLGGGGGFTVMPRRGELIVFDKLARSLVQQVVLAVPTKVSKGVLVAPTVFGNVMVGPTAEDVTRKDDTSSTAAGLDYLHREAGRIVPAPLDFDVTAVYAGLRPRGRAGRRRRLSGRHAAAAVVRYLEDGDWPARRVPIVCEAPLGWIAPNVVGAAPRADRAAARPARGRFALRSHDFLRAPRIEVVQSGSRLWSGRLVRVMLGRSTWLPHGWVERVDLAAGPVRVRLAR